MRIFLIVLLVASLSCSSLATGQSPAVQISGNYFAQGLLKRLVNPDGTSFRVGIINTAAEFGILISPKGASPIAEYFRGYSTARDSTWNLSWTARESLEASVDNLRFEVMRKRVDSRSCPELEEGLNRFYAELESVLQPAITLTETPPEVPPEVEEVTVDGTSYIIQIGMGEMTLAIYPDIDADADPDLSESSRVLMNVIGGCANELPGEIERHNGR